MQIQSKDLLKSLQRATLDIIDQSKKYLNLTNEQLNYRQSSDSWSILECIEHLNRYGRFYIPEIQKRIAASNSSSVDIFKSGLLGNYFANTMKPRPKLNKMKTFKEMNPIGSNLGVAVIEEFLTQQAEILEILKQANNVNLNKIKTGISISKFIKLRLGDTLRVVIYHNERHVEQANRLINR